MVVGLIGKKLAMTQLFTQEEGEAVPVTVLQAGPCVIVQKKTGDKDGYRAVQLGLVEARKPRRTNKPLEGHFKVAGVRPTRILREFPFSLSEGEELKIGQQLLVSDVFEVNQKVDVRGRTIGRGFQGVMKRHGFAGGQASHGSMFHRGPGSIGQSASPSRVLKGMKAPGHMGNRQVIARRLRVVQIDRENNLLLVKGAVPGSKGNYVSIFRSR